MANRDNTLYVRNGRPNKVVFYFNGVRYSLEHRGNRQDSAALPADAASDPNLSRWMKNGQLEQISKDAFMKLGTRTVDVLPNEYLKRPVRTGKGIEVPMQAAESDTTRATSIVADGDVHKMVRDNVSPKWAGELMTTDEEVESDEFAAQQRDQSSYPSRHRDDDTRRQMGY